MSGPVGVGTGLDAVLGIAEESAYGTFVAPTRWYEFNNQSLVPDVQVLEREAALGRGRFRKAADTRTFINGGSGSFQIDVLVKGAGLLFKHMLGNHSIEQLDDEEEAPTDEYLQTIVPDAYGLRELSLSVQAGVPMTETGEIQPFNFAGGKITQWELACAIDDILRLTPTMDFSQAFEMETALGSPSYPSDAPPFIFIDGAITIDSESVFVSSATLTGANALATNRRGLGNVKREPLANGLWEYSGQLTGEFENPDFLEAYIAGTPAAFVLNFENGEIPDGVGNYRLTVTIPVIRFTGEVPSVGGPDIVPQNIPFRAYEGDEDPIITIEYSSTDTAA